MNDSVNFGAAMLLIFMLFSVAVFYVRSKRRKGRKVSDYQHPAPEPDPNEQKK